VDATGDSGSIADGLCLSPDAVNLSLDAVKTHLRTLFRKLAIEHLPQNQRARLSEMAVQYGLVSTHEL
jgi:DNA-binding CsgD family transcriptional regulator